MLIHGLKSQFTIVTSTLDIKQRLKKREVLIWSPAIDELDMASVPASWDITSDSLAGILHLPVYTLCNSWLYKVMKTGFFRCTNEHKPSVHCTMKVYIHAISQSR